MCSLNQSNHPIENTLNLKSESKFKFDRQSSKAKKILENLKENHHLQAMTTLDERIVTCEACEILATKTLKNMSKAAVHGLLASTKGVSFPPFVQIKISEHHVMSSTFSSFTTELKGIPEDQVIPCLRDMGRKLCWLTKEELRQQKALSFEATNPSYGSIFYLIMKGVPVSSAEAVEVDVKIETTPIADMDMPDFSDGQIVPVTTKDSLTGMPSDSSLTEMERQEISSSLLEPCLSILYQRIHALNCIASCT